MGEVYRARDTRLGRDVALKILPEAFKDDPARVARFAREARVLASLNHPHIAALYGLEEADDVTALVMELVEGDDLSQSRRMDQALAIAKQTSEALEAAHEHGVIHRDLKPGNIRLRTDGTVKVLDFGLATALGTASDAATILAERQTRAGTIVGTPAYMSPEQARGEPLSRHTDIWSFGVILYELLTGVCPFARPTIAETLSSVLSEQPDSSQLPAARTRGSACAIGRRRADRQGAPPAGHRLDMANATRRRCSPRCGGVIRPRRLLAGAAARARPGSTHERSGRGLTPAAHSPGIVVCRCWSIARAARHRFRYRPATIRIRGSLRMASAWRSSITPTSSSGTGPAPGQRQPVLHSIRQSIGTRCGHRTRDESCSARGVPATSAICIQTISRRARPSG
jgi:serine/threonine protein kinase